MQIPAWNPYGSNLDDEITDVKMILNYILKLSQNRSQGGLLP